MQDTQALEPGSTYPTRLVAHVEHSLSSGTPCPPEVAGAPSKLHGRRCRLSQGRDAKGATLATRQDSQDLPRIRWHRHSSRHQMPRQDLQTINTPTDPYTRRGSAAPSPQDIEATGSSQGIMP